MLKLEARTDTALIRISRWVDLGILQTPLCSVDAGRNFNETKASKNRPFVEFRQS